MAIREALGEAFPRLQEHTSPIRLRHLAVLRGVSAISEKPLRCDGIISVNSSGSYLIQVNQDHPESRKRFTIAHEIGHTFFFDVDSEIRQRVRDTNLDRISSSDSEELLCNYAGAEILMPHLQFRSLVRAGGPGSESLIRMARHFNVSIQACSKRAVQLLRVKLAIVLWRYNTANQYYESRWTACFSSSSRLGRHRLTVKREDPAFKLFDTEDKYRGEVWISLGGPLDGYFVDVVAWGRGPERNVLTVFALEPNPVSVFSARQLPVNDAEQMSLF